MKRKRALWPRWLTFTCSECGAPRGTHASGCVHARPLTERISEAVKEARREEDAEAARRSQQDHPSLTEQADRSW